MPRTAIWQTVRLALVAILVCSILALTWSCGSDPETRKPGAGGRPNTDAGGVDASKPDSATPDSGQPRPDANPNCGNAALDPGEDCDDGNDVKGDGCEPSTCAFTCVPGVGGDDFCNDYQHCNGREICSENHVCVPGAPRPNGEVCGQSKVCENGTCGDAPHTCGDRILVMGIEECDDGNLIDGDGCDSDCQFSCVTGDTTRDCAAPDACAGKGICNDSTHVCGAPTPLPDDTDCGGGKRCRGGVCSPRTCGNLAPDPNEECDDGNLIPRDGCENGCTFTCLSSDATRNCALAEPCDGISTCNDSTHTCSTPTPLQNGAICGMNRYCSSRTCILAVCGNGSPEPTEQCDDGNTAEADGCTTQCKYTCLANPDCTDGNDCTTDICSLSSHTCSSTIDTTKNGQGCTINNNPGTCRNGDCVLAGCGNSIVDQGEECDTGLSNGTGAGCTSNCQFECDAEADCTDNNACSGSETCAIVAGGKKCQLGTPLGAGDECQTLPRRICNANLVCVLSQCGDLHVDPVIGEQCDDGNTNDTDGCQNDCHFGCQNDQGCSDSNACNGTETCITVSGGKVCSPGTPLQTGAVCLTPPRSICTSGGACVQSRCGDVFVDPGAGEQCDDGDTDPADGCKNDCTFTCTSNANCSDSNSCTRDECNTTLHTCSNPVDSTQNGLPCTAGTTPGTCQGAACVPAQCGNSIVDLGAGEECDRGALNGQTDSGCTASCQFQCDLVPGCDDGNACNGSEVCEPVTGGQRCRTGATPPLAKGAVCLASPRKICDANAGNCVSSICGDGLVDNANGGTEECDRGALNGNPTSGCTSTCQFACDTAADCDDDNDCNGVETCQTLTGGVGKTCGTGTPLNPGAVCLASPRRICSGALDCLLSTCGDGFVDTAQMAAPRNATRVTKTDR